MRSFWILSAAAAHAELRSGEEVLPAFEEAHGYMSTIGQFPMYTHRGQFVIFHIIVLWTIHIDQHNNQHSAYISENFETNAYREYHKYF